MAALGGTCFELQQTLLGFVPAAPKEEQKSYFIISS